MTTWLARHVTVLALLASLGAATMAGLLFAFSNFVMRALAQLPPAAGMEAMQRINVEIVNPVFLLVFMGTPLLFVLLVLAALHPTLASSRWWFVGGALCYVGGVLGVTALANIPLNNALAALRPAAAPQEWPVYVSAWSWWNHVRTVLAFASVVATLIGALGSAGAKFVW